ncbi:MAG: epoxyqueuosine reductase QueH [Clostridiales bacterium]|nr:epoxyqueuosine reductase QueH [Clostridiales bacterium]
MNNINYQKELDKILNKLKENKNTKTSLLLHSCCAPCSSYVLQYLTNYFDITVLYYNPNITDRNEYEKRKSEQIRLIGEMPHINDINIIDTEHEPEKFYDIAKGLENCPECGERCLKCYKLRLEKTAQTAKENNFDYFCTTLTISPLKSSKAINQIGIELAKQYGVEFLPSDFKKKEGFKTSIELSKKYGLYRQNYCGCEFSKPEI